VTKEYENTYRASIHFLANKKAGSKDPAFYNYGIYYFGPLHLKPTAVPAPAPTIRVGTTGKSKAAPGIKTKAATAATVPTAAPIPVPLRRFMLNISFNFIVLSCYFYKWVVSDIT
jgi:hypothetical protein